MQPYIVELTALAVVLAGVIAGAVRGLLLTLYSLVKMVLMIAFAFAVYPVIAKMLPDDIGWGTGAAVLIAMAAAAVILGLIARVLRLVDKIPVLHGLNKIGGALLGGVLGILVVCVALFIISMSRQAEWCREIYPCVKQSAILSDVLDSVSRSISKLNIFSVKHF